MEAQSKNASATIRAIKRRYYTVQLLYSFGNGCLAGVYPLFLRARGLNQFEINSVLATFFAVLFLTDVPTGAFADAMGRRRSFIVGTSFRVVAFLVYFFSHHYVFFLIGESIDGIGCTFCNGAIDAWGVDALDEAGFEGLKDRLFSRIAQLSNLGFVIAAIIGSYIAMYDIAWPWLLGAAGYLAAGAIGAYLMRGEKRRGGHVALAAMPAQIAGRIATGLREGLSRRAVMYLSIAGAIQLAAWAPYWLEWPAFFKDSFAIGIWVVGWITCLLAIARTIGAEFIARCGVEEQSRPSVVAALAIAAAAILFTAGLCGPRPMIVLALLFAMNLFTGAIEPLTRTWFNELIESDERATLLSFSSTFGTFGGSMGLLLQGRVADAYGVGTAWRMSGLLALTMAPCYLALRRRAGATTEIAAAPS